MTPFFHLSVDDVLTGLIETSDRGRALASDRMFAALDRLNDEFDVSIDLYLFAEAQLDGARRRLDEISPTVAAELRARPWLRLGPHAEDPSTPPHRQSPADAEATLARLFGAIDRLVGRTARSQWVRLHEFSEAYEAAPMLRANGVEALLTTDKAAIAWRLPPEPRAILQRHGRTHFGGIEFVRSHLRAELLVAEGLDRPSLLKRLSEIVDAHGFLVIFTHEICFSDARTTAMLRDVMEGCRALGLRSL